MFAIIAWDFEAVGAPSLIAVVSGNRSVVATLVDRTGAALQQHLMRLHHAVNTLVIGQELAALTVSASNHRAGTPIAITGRSIDHGFKLAAEFFVRQGATSPTRCPVGATRLERETPSVRPTALIAYPLAAIRERAR